MILSGFPAIREVYRTPHDIVTYTLFKYILFY
nr:MAG TPA: hypothetical protein [Caudoviricetes sp.]